MAEVTIFHNPGCSTSRRVLAALRDAGIKPKVVEYLKTGWTKSQLKALFAEMGVTAREAMRVRGTPAEELGLTNPSATDATILKAMVQHPILVERPIVVTDKGAAIVRPMERLAGLL